MAIVDQLTSVCGNLFIDELSEGETFHLFVLLFLRACYSVLRSQANLDIKSTSTGRVMVRIVETWGNTLLCAA